ncbi:hypothetical protein PFFCH_04111 [Plasmodium falciparum FCH/4]|uniref:Uncharacterized protein n=1 Tax=Plasmodium falciparum FCH/4 TaxID=1036724 RepID=A0A024VJW5_PLAFA|nr:hypothetical protein PFFCH_04111 [Plasmodium falciparum FCH/4]
MNNKMLTRRILFSRYFHGPSLYKRYILIKNDIPEFIKRVNFNSMQKNNNDKDDKVKNLNIQNNKNEEYAHTKENCDNIKSPFFNDILKKHDKKNPDVIPNFIIDFFTKESTDDKKNIYINEYKNVLLEFIQYKIEFSKDDSNKHQIKFVDIFSMLYFCYMERIYDLDFLTELSKQFDNIYKSKNTKDLLNNININYLMMMFYYFSFLKVSNGTLDNILRDFIINNEEVEPVLIYKYFECLSLLSDVHDNNKIVPIIEIFIENFYNFNNYILLNILQFLHKMNFFDKNIFSLLTRKINKNVYEQNANLFEVCMLSRIYALYKNENITFNNYLLDDLIQTITRHEDNFQNDELYEEEDKEYYNKVDKENDSSNIKQLNNNNNNNDHIEQFNNPDSININSNNDIDKNNETNDNDIHNLYIQEIKNINRDNYTLFKNSLYNDGLNFYSFFLNSKSTNKNLFKKKENIHIEINNDKKKSTSKMLHMSQWDKLFFYEDYKTKDIKNEPFINMHKNKNGNNNNNNNKNKNIDNKENLHIDKYINMYNDFIRENLYYEFNYQKMIDVFKNICIHLDNTKIAIYINKKDNMLSCNNNKICRYRKKLLFIDNYYIGHIFYIIDSMLSLNMHHNSSNFNKLQNKVLNLIKNNETYIIDNFDSKEIKSVLIFLVHTDRYYKESFIYSITHRIIDLYINNLCDAKTLSIYLYNLLAFTKQTIVKKNRFNHTIKNVVYNTYLWLNNNKNVSNEQGQNNKILFYNNIKVTNYTLLQILSIYICKNVYFISLPILASLLRSFSYLSFNDINFYNVFIPLFLKHIKYLKNVDILNITQAYNRQKINNKYFYYLLSKQYQNANSKDNKKSSVEVKLIG